MFRLYHLLPLVGILCGFPRSAAMAAESPPNFVFILTDDQGYGDLGCYGLKTARTPNIDRLAEEGTRFTDFYVHPVCGPTRSALLSGRYASRSKGWSMPASEITFASLLRERGYATACFGKWDVSNRRSEAGRVPNDRGFDEYWGPLGANDKGVVTLWNNRERVGEDKDLASLSRRYTDKAIDFIERHKDRPFLVYLAHTMMHTVVDASPEFRDRTGNGLYADTLEELDHEVGRLVEAIDRMGIGDNTLIVFTSDNGPWNNDQERQHEKNAAHVPWSKGPEIAWGDAGPLRDGKGSIYEGGVRVPMIARWTGTVPAKRDNGAIMHIVDFFPTFARLAGFEMPSDRVIDGVDQSDLLLGKSETGARDSVYYVKGGGPKAVRKGDWKFFAAGKGRGGRYGDDENGEPALFNLRDDIGETKNVLAEHPEVASELDALLSAYQPEPGEKKQDDHTGLPDAKRKAPPRNDRVKAPQGNTL